MGALYRSEKMRFCQMIVEKDAAFACVAEIGKQPCVQFKDLNAETNAFQRMFVRDIRRFDEMERKLRFLENQIRKDDIPIIDNTYNEENNVMSHHEIVQLEQTLTDLERDVIHMNNSDYQLKKNFLELKEWEAVLEKTDQFFQGGIGDAAVQEIEHAAQDTEAGVQLRTDKDQMRYTVGIIAHEKVNAFERVLWRACRRTAFLRYSEVDESLENPDTGEKMEELVFIVFYNGDRLRDIIDKVSEGFKAKQYNNCPKTSQERHATAARVHANIADMSTVIGQTKEHRLKVLKAAAANLRVWFKQVRLHKSIYHTLNFFTFDGIGKFFVAECWIPLRDIDTVRHALEIGVGKNGGTVKPVLNILHTDEVPPTYNRINKFTEVFQSIVDSYGIASYLEVNPAPYTIITFPFIFACMFGDFGHGMIMFIAALYMLRRERNLQESHIQDEIFRMFFNGRYIILLMGLFSLHAGIIYNDTFAKSINVFGSSWRNPYNESEFKDFENTMKLMDKELDFELNPKLAYMHDEGPYVFGMDPIWNVAENKLNFLNSMKMKLSIIVGVAQMTFGVCLSYQNHKFFKSAIDIYTVFIPQIIFMACIFMYLCLKIILKWIFYWVDAAYIFGKLYPGSHCAPSLLIGLIDMLMFKGRNETFVDLTSPLNLMTLNGLPRYTEVDACYLSQWYPGQSLIESFLVVIAIICVPVMLFAKPIYILIEQKKAKQAMSDNIFVRVNIQKEETEVVLKNGVENGGGANGIKSAIAHDQGCVDHGGDVHHDESFGDIIVYQAIHTIEYVLGCVSHTASYLRLWALSLAHAQLSEVLWTMLLKKGLTATNERWMGASAIYLMFFFFAVLTSSILVLMEGLSAFLHALRLHWVEFQSKFYMGLGYPFVAFSFKDVLQKAREADFASA